MSKLAYPLLAVLLLAVGFGLGRSFGGGPSSTRLPVRPATQEEMKLWTEQKGELRAILMERDLMARAARLSARLRELGPEAVPAVATLLQAGAFGLGSTEAALLTRFWAMHDPEGASDWALAHSAPLGVRAIVSETAIEVYATQDPEAVRPMLETFVSQVSDSIAESAQAAFVRGWFQSGQPGLEQEIQKLGPGAPQSRLLSILVQEMIHRDGVDSVIAWVEAFPEDDPRFAREAYRAVAPELAKADLQKALAWCERHCEKGHGEHVRALIARAWAREDGPAAMAWVEQAPAGDERDRAVWATFTHWRETDPVSLLAWIDTLDPDTIEPWLYPAVDRIAMWKSWDYPLVAYRWAAKIPEPTRRERAMITIAHRHREVDPQGADAWLESSPLSEEAREKARVLPEGFKGRGKRPVPEAYRLD